MKPILALITFLLALGCCTPSAPTPVDPSTEPCNLLTTSQYIQDRCCLRFCRGGDTKVDAYKSCSAIVEDSEMCTLQKRVIMSNNWASCRCQ